MTVSPNYDQFYLLISVNKKSLLGAGQQKNSNHSSRIYHKRNFKLPGNLKKKVIMA